MSNYDDNTTSGGYGNDSGLSGNNRMGGNSYGDDSLSSGKLKSNSTPAHPQYTHVR